MRSSLTALALTLVLAALSAASSFAQAAPRISLDELRKLHASGGALVVDVRDAQSFANGHIPGAINVPLGTEQQPEHLGKLNAAGKRPIVTYCAWPDEATSARAALAYAGLGFKDVKALKGGWAAWLNAGGPSERSK